MKILYLTLVIAVLLSACGGQSTPYPTYTPEPTQTPYPTYTPQATTTFTPEPTSTPVPDTKVVLEEPREFVLAKADLPKAADYIVPNELWSSPLTNDEIIQSRGIEEGNKYLVKTGRVRGWESGFLRRNKGTGAEYPYELVSTVIQYKTADGAKYPITEEMLKETGYKIIEVPSGDLAVVFEDTFDGGTNTYFEGYRVDELFVAVQHRNILIEIDLMGFHDAGQVSQDFAVELALKIIEKIDAADLYPEWEE